MAQSHFNEHLPLAVAAVTIRRHEPRGAIVALKARGFTVIRPS